MKLTEAMENLKFDKRMTDWSYKKETLTRTEMNTHLSELPDLTHLAKKMDIFNSDDVAAATEEVSSVEVAENTSNGLSNEYSNEGNFNS